jgi:hypothetical protein
MTEINSAIGKVADEIISKQYDSDSVNWCERSLLYRSCPWTNTANMIQTQLTGVKGLYCTEAVHKQIQPILNIAVRLKILSSDAETS